jgi:8-oxo-dGTP pyrophosphatase MutT (NUDIX family)
VIDRPPPVAPRPAATVVLLRPGRGGLEVLLTRRPSSMRFGANLFVFPGGRLDEGEDARTAGARETLEETGIDVDPGALVPLTRWVTPPSLPIRYDTCFFGTLVDPGTDVHGPSDEVVEWRWLHPTEALEAMASARMAMWQPTVVTLQQLEPVADEASLQAAFAPRDAHDAAVSDLRDLPGAHLRAFEHRWAGGIEGRTAVTVAVGDRSWVIVDPGDPTGDTSDRILAAADAAGAELAGVVITSLGPDRHAGVEMLATGLGLPVAGPPGASGLVPYAVMELADREPVPFGDARLAALRDRAPRSPADGWEERAAAIRIVPAHTAARG